MASSDSGRLLLQQLRHLRSSADVFLQPEEPDADPDADPSGDEPAAIGVHSLVLAAWVPQLAQRAAQRRQLSQGRSLSRCTLCVPAAAAVLQLAVDAMYGIRPTHSETLWQAVQLAAGVLRAEGAVHEHHASLSAVSSIAVSHTADSPRSDLHPSPSPSHSTNTTTATAAPALSLSAAGQAPVAPTKSTITAGNSHAFTSPLNEAAHDVDEEDDLTALKSPLLAQTLAAALILDSPAAAARAWRLASRADLPQLRQTAVATARRLLAHPQAPALMPPTLLEAAINHQGGGPLPLANEDAVLALLQAAVQVHTVAELRRRQVDFAAAQQLCSSIRADRLSAAAQTTHKILAAALGVELAGTGAADTSTAATMPTRNFANSVSQSGGRRKLPTLPPQARARRSLPEAASTPAKPLSQGPESESSSSKTPNNRPEGRKTSPLASHGRSSSAAAGIGAGMTPRGRLLTQPVTAQPSSAPPKAAALQSSVAVQTDFVDISRASWTSEDNAPLRSADSGFSTLSPKSNHSFNLDLDSEKPTASASPATAKRSPPPLLTTGRRAHSDSFFNPSALRAGDFRAGIEVTSLDEEDERAGDEPQASQIRRGLATLKPEERDGAAQGEEEEEEEEEEEGREENDPPNFNMGGRQAASTLEWDDDDLLGSRTSSPAASKKSGLNRRAHSLRVRGEEPAAGESGGSATVTTGLANSKDRPGSAPFSLLLQHSATTAPGPGAGLALQATLSARASPQNVRDALLPRRSARRAAAREATQRILRRTLSAGNTAGRAASASPTGSQGDSGVATPDHTSLLTLPPPALWTDDQVWEPTLFVMGGSGVDGIGHTVQSYHRATEAWVTMADSILPREQACCAVWRENIFVFGGLGVEGSAERYNILAGVWETVKPSYACLSGAGACTVGDLIYVTGGLGPDGSAQTQLQTFDPVRSQWTELSSAPAARALHACVSVAGRYVVLIGGVGEDGLPTATVSAYDTVNARWFELPPLLEARSRCAAVVVDSTVVVLGGKAFDGRALSSVEYLQVSIVEECALAHTAAAAHASWEAGPNMPHARHDMAACVFFGRIGVLGGSSPTLDLHGSDAILLLDMKEQRWGYHGVLAGRRRSWGPSGRNSSRVNPGRAVLSTLGVRSKLCAAVVYCPAQAPSVELLEAVAEFERDFGTLNFPSGAKTVFNVIRSTNALQGCALEDVVAHPSTPSRKRVEALLQWLTEQGLIYSSVQDHYLPTLNLDSR